MSRLLIVSLIVVLPTAVRGQQDTTAVLKAAVQLPRAEEIALARSAAPEVIAQNATIWVLGTNGYEQAHAGTNGWGCIVQRATSGQSLIPRCDDADGVAALYPPMRMLEEMRAQGKTSGAYQKALTDGYRTGKFHAPRRGSLAYMLSVDGFFVMPGGAREVFTPHVMINWPNCAARELGVSSDTDIRKTHLSFVGLGAPDCHLIINTPENTAQKSAVPLSKRESP